VLHYALSAEAQNAVRWYFADELQKTVTSWPQNIYTLLHIKRSESGVRSEGSVWMDLGDIGQMNREAWCAHMIKVYGTLHLRWASSFTFVAYVQGCQLELQGQWNLGSFNWLEM
jgi:hypothetical protein